MRLDGGGRRGMRVEIRACTCDYCVVEDKRRREWEAEVERRLRELEERDWLTGEATRKKLSEAMREERGWRWREF